MRESEAMDAEVMLIFFVSPLPRAAVVTQGGLFRPISVLVALEALYSQPTAPGGFANLPGGERRLLCGTDTEAVRERCGVERARAFT